MDGCIRIQSGPVVHAIAIQNMYGRSAHRASKRVYWLLVVLSFVRYRKKPSRYQVCYCSPLPTHCTHTAALFKRTVVPYSTRSSAEHANRNSSERVVIILYWSTVVEEYLVPGTLYYSIKYRKSTVPFMPSRYSAVHSTHYTLRKLLCSRNFATGKICL
jgi:hypothetical protein